MQEEIIYHIHSSKHRLEAIFNCDNQEIRILLVSKENNYPAKCLQAVLPKQIMEKDPEGFFRQVCRYRALYIQPELKFITLLFEKEPKIMLKNITQQSEYQKNQTLKQDGEVNFDMKHWWVKRKNLEIRIVLDPQHKQLSVMLLERSPFHLKTAEILIHESSLLSNSPLKGKHQKDQLLSNLLQHIKESRNLRVDWEKKVLNGDKQLLEPIPFINSVIIAKPQHLYSKKIQLFKHIFLTELITHMIVHWFGKPKEKIQKDRNGYKQIQYGDEELEIMRSWGLRFSEFRDHPFKLKKEKKSMKKVRIQQNESSNESDDDDYQDDDQEDEQEICDEQSEEEQGKQRYQKKQPHNENKKIKIQIMKQKLLKSAGICNFTFISGKEKSRINKMRYCLHQMTRQTDKTQALIDFVGLVFKVYGKKNLIRHKNELILKNTMAHFLSQFKVKGKIQSCFKQYTRESFFHQILNTGLRVFKNPFELAYLRLPFSHMFWGIKIFYHRHKRALFESKKEKNDNRTIVLYRGFSIDEKEAKRLWESIDGYIEVEGLLSTSLDQQMAYSFTVNARMKIQIPVENLRGMFDNGFAHINRFSVHPNEKEVLINAFNLFKVLSVSSTYEEGKDKNEQLIVYTVRLQYGSIKPIEEKVKKSQKLLEAEFMSKMNELELKTARKKLEVNKEKLSKKMYDTLALLLPKAEQQIKRQKEHLKNWADEEYEAALKNLSGWQEELIVSTNHQRKRILYMENYGQLLYELDQNQRAAIYLSKIIKQVELGKSIEGYHWRKSRCLLFKQRIYRYRIADCYQIIGRYADSLLHAEKLLDVYLSINMPQETPKYYQSLFLIWKLCDDTVDKKEEAKKYKKKLKNILEKYQLFDTFQYKFFKQENKKKGEQIKDDEEEKEKKDKERKDIQKRLKQIELKGDGKYSMKYLAKLGDWLQTLFQWEKWGQVVKEGMKYLSIRRRAPQVVDRIGTYEAFETILQSCYKEGSKEEFRLTCSQLATFLKLSIYHNFELSLIQFCFELCLRSEQWKAARLIIFKLTKCKIKCKVAVKDLDNVALYGYALLLKSLSQGVWDFVLWIQNVYKQQKYTNQYQYQQIISYIIQYNYNYQKAISKKKEQNIIIQRHKEYEEAKIIKYVCQMLNSKGARWAAKVDNEREDELITWQSPFYPLKVNRKYTKHFQYRYLLKQKHILLLELFQQKSIMYTKRLSHANTKKYLRKIYTLSKLHLSDVLLRSIPSLLQFWAYETKYLHFIQKWDMGMSLVKLMQDTQQIREDLRNKYVQEAIHKQSQLEWRKQRISDYKVNMKNHLVKKINSIYARYQCFLLLTSRRRLKTTQNKPFY